MTFPLPTDTSHVKIESRQYRLGFDLGEGIPRSALKVGAALFVPWFFFCWQVGIPLMQGGLALWITPPLLFTARGYMRDASGRIRIAAWRDAAGWLLRRHTTVITNGDTASSTSRPISTDLSFLVVDTKGTDRATP